MKRVLIFMLLIGLIGAAGFYAVRHFSSRPTTTEADKGAEDAADLKHKVYSFEIDGKTSKGVKQWHLEGKEAEMIGDEIHLEGLDVVAYGEDFTVNLTSDKGIYRKNKAEVELIGDVKVVSEDGAVLTTDRAKWLQTTREITTDSVVNIERENMRARGRGALANSFERRAVLLTDVTVEMEPATLVECDGSLDVRFEDNKAVFSENVRVTDKDGKLFSDTLTVYFDPETRKIAEVVAENNVKVWRGKSYTLCEKATYTDGTRSVKFTGNPRVVIAPEELTESGLFSGKGIGIGGQSEEISGEEQVAKDE